MSERKTGRQTDRQTNKQTDGQTDRWTGRQTEGDRRVRGRGRKGGEHTVLGEEERNFPPAPLRHDDNLRILFCKLHKILLNKPSVCQQGIVSDWNRWGDGKVEQVVTLGLDSCPLWR